MYDSNKIKCYVGHTVNTEIYHGVSPDVVGVRLFSILFSVLDFGDRSSVFSHARNNISLRRGCFFFSLSEYQVKTNVGPSRTSSESPY